ncbi:MAG: DUF5687 family protein [Cyclobacteriaceae bacterium]
MIAQLLKHQWLSFRRSSSFGREIGIIVFIIFMGIIIFFFVFILALALPGLLKNGYEISDPITFINGFLSYYFLTELFIRYFAQKIPVLSIEPYLILPVRRSFIIRFLLIKSIFHPFNIISVILFTPFAIQIVTPQEGGMTALQWMAALIFTSMSLHFFNIIFKKYLDDKGWVWTIIIGFAVINLFFTDVIDLDLFAPIAWFFNGVVTNTWLMVLPLFLMVGFLIISYRLMIKQLYLEEIAPQTGGSLERYTEKLSFLGRSGLVNTLMLQELKMILRHKRTKSVIIISLFFVAYGLIFFTDDAYPPDSAIFVFLGIFMSGIFTINYGQFMWSWNTNQMDFFFTRPLAMKSWLKSRYQLILYSCVLAIILSIPYVYFGWHALWIVLAGGLYNIGINIPLMVRMSLWSPKPINLNQSSMFNFSGAGIAQWVMGIPVVVGPYLFYTPIALIFNHNAGLLAVAVAGIIGFSLRDMFLTYMVGELQKYKYALIKNLVI